MERNDWPRGLLAWFDANRRDLPWRESKPRNPYHVWISEIMLQQTRTEAVKPYFSAWMERFPTISDVAAADEAEVLHAWQGLGYYSRARNIHKAAQVIAEQYGGVMPRDRRPSGRCRASVTTRRGRWRPSPTERSGPQWTAMCSAYMPGSMRCGRIS